MFGSKSDVKHVPPSAVVPVMPMANAAPIKPVQLPDAFIGPQITIKGDIHYEGDLRIQGRVHGNIFAVGSGDSTLHIENGAEVNGDVTVQTIRVDGFVSGNITSVKLIEISSSGEVTGPIKYANIAIESGAIVDGQLTPTDVVEAELSPVQAHAETYDPEH